MASFPSTQPPDSVEIATYIRWWLCGVSTSVISDQDMIDLITPNITKYDTSLCKITYYSTIDILNYLIRCQDASKGTSGGDGALTRRREKRGKTEIEVEYGDSTASSSSGWDKILSGLYDDPSSIGCDPLSDVNDDDKIRAPIIGGADINGYQEGFRTRQKFGAAIKENRCSSRYGAYGRRLF